MQIIESIQLISINGTLLFQLASFLLFLFLINRIMIRPLRRSDGERKTHLDAIVDDIAEAQSTCDEIDRQMKQQENEVRKTASAIRDELETAGIDAANKLINKTMEEINGLKSRAKKENEAKLESIRAELESEAAAVANQMMISILGRRIES